LQIGILKLHDNARRPMDKCPPEIHERIIAYACTDDGTTGCALSLVSKYIYEVSSPYRWQCIALPGYECILRFADLICNAKPRRPIYHLFLSDRRSQASAVQQYMEFERKFLPAFELVLAYAGSTLRTLSFFSDANLVDAATSLRRCLCISFPQLRELTLRACCTPGQLIGPYTLTCEIPNLVSLHLALLYHGFSSDGLQATQRLISFISPSISQLRFTMLDSRGSRRVIEVIHSELAESGIVPPVLDLPPSSSSDSLRVATAIPVTWDNLLPKTLELFVVRPSPSTNADCACCLGPRGDADSDVLRTLERMSELADKSRFVYITQRPISWRKCQLVSPLRVTGYNYVEAKCDWLERVEARAGCWQQRCGGLDDDESSDEGDRAPSSTAATLGEGEEEVRKPSRKLAKLKKVFKKLAM
jgi:hypothetical protein